MVPKHGAWEKVGIETKTLYPGINRLNKIAKQNDIDYSRAKNLRFSGKRIQR